MIGIQIKNLYLRTDVRQIQIHAGSICNIALRGLTLIQLNVARIVGTGIFLIRYAEGHAKQTYRQLKKFTIIFNKPLFI